MSKAARKREPRPHVFVDMSKGYGSRNVHVIDSKGGKNTRDLPRCPNEIAKLLGTLGVRESLTKLGARA